MKRTLTVLLSRVAKELKRLNTFGVCKNILCNFHQCFFESLLWFSFLCWFKGLSVKDKKCLHGFFKVCSKIIGAQLSLGEKKSQKARIIIIQPDHVLVREFSPSRTNRCGLFHYFSYQATEC